MTPEIAAKIMEVRMKVLREEYTLDDIKEAVEMYRSARGVVATRVEEKAAKATRPKAPRKTKADKARDLLNTILDGEK